MSEKREAGGDEDGFLARWSRRKAEARRGDGDPEPRPTQDTGVDREPAPEEAAVRAEDLPDIDSLTAESDFKLFMRDGVPEELKTRALRRLWRLKPSLANLDGLVDYGEDFTDQATVVAGMRTAYRAGRGYLERVREAEDAGGAAAPEELVEPPARPTAETDAGAPDAGAGATGRTAAGATGEGQEETGPSGPRPPPPRRA